jgi:hypothetical protein
VCAGCKLRVLCGYTGKLKAGYFLILDEMSFSIDKWVLGVFAFFLLACGGNDEKQEINRNDNHEKQVETKSYEILWIA